MKTQTAQYWNRVGLVVMLIATLISPHANDGWLKYTVIGLMCIGMAMYLLIWEDTEGHVV